MIVLVVGSVGRVHALVWKLRQSAVTAQLFCATGNAGINEIAETVPVKATDIDELVKFALEHKIDLTVVGPEQPLIQGIVDAFEDHGLNIFGPRKLPAMIEGSKVFAKEFMRGTPNSHGGIACLQQGTTVQC